MLKKEEIFLDFSFKTCHNTITKESKMNEDLYTIQEWHERAGYKPKACINDCLLSSKEWGDILLKEALKKQQLDYIRIGCGFGPVPKKGLA